LRHRLPSRLNRFLMKPEDIAMNHRLLTVTAVAAFSLTCVKSAEAGTSVRISYVAPAVVYAPPPRVVYTTVPVRTVVVTPPVPVAIVPAPPPPRPPVVVYAPPARVVYAQPVVAAPVVVMR
jgi:hypothetical protein